MEYPANRNEFFNGTQIPVDKFGGMDTIRGMEGVMSESWYQKELKIPRFGRLAPLDFHGFNNQSDFFPFWSSEPYTYVTSLLALSTYSNIE